MIKLWLPWAIRDGWAITSSRTQYTLAWDISGSGSSWPGLHREPVVEIYDLPGLKFDSALSYVASSPSSTEFTLPGTTVSDSSYITTGDLSGKAGKLLMIWGWGLMEVRPTGMEQGFDGPGNWGQTLPLEFAPSPRDYEGD